MKIKIDHRETDLIYSCKNFLENTLIYQGIELEIVNLPIGDVIEGDLNKVSSFKGRIDKTLLYSAIFSLNYYKGFSVLRTQSIEETANLVCHMIYKLKKGTSENKQPYYQDGTTSCATEEKDYCNVVKKVKKDNITSNNIGEIMLCQIPGVSSTIAITIMKEFKSLPHLVMKLKEDNNCLKDISYCNAKGQTRKVSKTAIENIKKFLIVELNVEQE